MEIDVRPSRRYAAPFRLAVPAVDRVMADERAEAFRARGVRGEAKLAGLRLAVGLMDLTSLEGADTPGRIRHLCAKARRPMDERYGCPPVAAVCVYPTLVATARRELAGSGIRVASVAGGFPAGQSPLRARLEEVKRAVGDGADEIDMVIARGAFLAGEWGRVYDGIAAVREACGPAHLKAILETGELGSYDHVRLAGALAIRAGAHFIKTSTGKIGAAATLPVTLVMLETVRDHYVATGERIGVKPAGGIRTSREALQYLVAVRETLGAAWLSPDLFRFGASGLLSDVVLQIGRMGDGVDRRAEDFSLP